MLKDVKGGCTQNKRVGRSTEGDDGGFPGVQFCSTLVCLSAGLPKDPENFLLAK